MNNIKKPIIVFDCDGVITSGKFVYTSEGKVSKEFGPHDMDGIKLLNKHGFNIIKFISADKRGFEITKKRILDMGFDLEYVTEDNRLNYIQDLEKTTSCPIIFMGDGISDVESLKYAIRGIAPNNARPEAKAAANYITPSNGGEGALLDAALYIIKEWDNVSLKSNNKKYLEYSNILNNILYENKNILYDIDIERIERFIKYLLGAKENNKKIVCVGAGRMGYSIRAFAMRLMHLGFDATFIGDTDVPYTDKINSIVIFNSSSGETKTNVLYMDILKDLGYNKPLTITITSNPKSYLASNSDLYIELPYTFVSNQPMKTIHEQSSYLFFDIIVRLLMKELNIENTQLVKNHSILE